MFKSKNDKKEDDKKKDNNADNKKEVKNNGTKSGSKDNNDTCNLEGDAKKPLDDCEGCKDEVLHETDEAAGKPIVGFSEKVGASFRKWFHLAGAPE